MNELTGEVAIDHLTRKVEQLDMVRSRLSSLKEEEQQLIAEIRAGIGEHQFGTISGEPAIRLDSRTNTHLDREAVKALIGPEALGTVTRLTPYVTVKLVGRFRRSAK